MKYILLTLLIAINTAFAETNIVRIIGTLEDTTADMKCFGELGNDITLPLEQLINDNILSINNDNTYVFTPDNTVLGSSKSCFYRAGTYDITIHSDDYGVINDTKIVHTGAIDMSKTVFRSTCNDDNNDVIADGNDSCSLQITLKDSYNNTIYNDNNNYQWHIKEVDNNYEERIFDNNSRFYDGIHIINSSDKRVFIKDVYGNSRFETPANNGIITIPLYFLVPTIKFIADKNYSQYGYSFIKERHLELILYDNDDDNKQYTYTFDALVKPFLAVVPTQESIKIGINTLQFDIQYDSNMNNISAYNIEIDTGAYSKTLQFKNDNNTIMPYNTVYNGIQDVPDSIGFDTEVSAKAITIGSIHTERGDKEGEVVNISSISTDNGAIKQDIIHTYVLYSYVSYILENMKISYFAGIQNMDFENNDDTTLVNNETDCRKIVGCSMSNASMNAAAVEIYGKTLNDTEPYNHMNTPFYKPSIPNIPSKIRIIADEIMSTEKEYSSNTIDLKTIDGMQIWHTGDIEIDGNELIKPTILVVKDGNIHIKNNIIGVPITIIGINSKQEIMPQKGNIMIDSIVDTIHMYAYLDGGILADSDNKSDTTLTIYGSLNSYNTAYGSLESDDLRTPWGKLKQLEKVLNMHIQTLFMSNDIVKEVQKYDITQLRNKNIKLIGTITKR